MVPNLMPSILLKHGIKASASIAAYVGIFWLSSVKRLLQQLELEEAPWISHRQLSLTMKPSKWTSDICHGVDMLQCWLLSPTVQSVHVSALTVGHGQRLVFGSGTTGPKSCIQSLTANSPSNLVFFRDNGDTTGGEKKNLISTCRELENKARALALFPTMLHSSLWAAAGMH